MSDNKVEKLPLGKLKSIFGKNIKMFNLKKVKLDKEATYSVTHHKYSEQIVNYILKHMDKKKEDITITDACACVGSDTINFGKHFKKVNAIELDKTRYDFLNHNIKLSGLKNINTIKGDSLKHLNKLKQDVIFIDAPWGGPDYKYKKELNLYLSGKPLTEIANDHMNDTKLMVLKVPNNFTFRELKKKSKYKIGRKYDLGKFQLVILKN